MKVIEVDFPSNQYYTEETKKKQIVLHHTVSDPKSYMGDKDSWLSDSMRIATYCIIGYDGVIYKCFKSTQSGAHLGIKAVTLKELGFKDYGKRNLLLDTESIAIEIDCWGGLTKKGDQFINAYGRPISKDLQVVSCDWRGFKYFQKYSDAQIQTLSELLPLLMKSNNIDNYGLKDGNFDVRKDALSSVSGIFSHSNYRSDKSDLYKDDRIISMLNNL